MANALMQLCYIIIVSRILFLSQPEFHVLITQTLIRYYYSFLFMKFREIIINNNS